MRKYKISKSDLQAGQENSTPQPEGDRPFDSRVIRNAINVLPQLKTKLEFLALVLYEEEGLVVATPVFVAQAAIVGGRQWKNVQTILSRRIPKRGAERNKQGALLKGVLYCPSCNQPMRHTYTSRNEQRYRYYVCTKGEHGCRNRTAAVRLEASVLERLAEVAQNHAVLGETGENVRSTEYGFTGTTRSAAYVGRAGDL
jgi:hypothetical protein